MEPPSVADYPPGARMAPRLIHDFEFVWMLRGQARFATDDEELLLSPGRLLLVPPGVGHSFLWDHQRASRHGFVHFHPEQVGAQAPDQVRLRRMTEHDPFAGLCAYLLWLGREQGDGWEQQATEALRFLLMLFNSRHLPRDDAPAVLPSPLSAALDHLRGEWSQMPLRRISVGELAASARVSRSYLNRLFQSAFRISPASALERLRCSRAESLLTGTDMTMSAIASQCGFADLYHFSHRFIRLHGVPPSVYRDAGSPAVSVLDHPAARWLAHALWE